MITIVPGLGNKSEQNIVFQTNYANLMMEKGSFNRSKGLLKIL